MPRYIEPGPDMVQERYTNPEESNPEEALLRQLSEKNLKQLLRRLELAAPESVYKQRLETELQILVSKGYCGYFLIVADYVRWAKDNDIAVGPGRGSGPCSLVGFVMGITGIDPIRYELPFERFVNPEKESHPDFDLDFCDDRRSEVTAYIQSKYGQDRVAQISSDDTRPLPSRLVICDRPLANIVSLYENPESGFPTAKMNMSQIASAGLVRFNAINQKAITVIQNRVRALEQSGQSIDINRIPLDDKGAFQLLSAGEASNIAVLDDDHYKNTLIAVQPNQFKQLCAIIALCQPRSHTNIPLYVERKKLFEQENSVERKEIPDSVRYFHPALKSITAETYGLVIYQEQVMHIAHEIAGLCFAQADSFRRTLKTSAHGSYRGPKHALKHTYKHKFIDGAVKYGLPKADAIALYEYVEFSEQRSATKAHAVAFATIAYQTAWLKANGA